MLTIETVEVGEYLYGVEQMAKLLVKRHLGQPHNIAEGNTLIKKYKLRQADVLTKFNELLEETA